MGVQETEIVLCSLWTLMIVGSVGKLRISEVFYSTLLLRLEPGGVGISRACDITKECMDGSWSVPEKA